MPVQPQTFRSQQLILTIYGLYGRDNLPGIPVAALVQMLGELGVDAPGVRSSVSRLKQRGILASDRRRGVAAYAVSADAVQLFVDGDARIYAPARSLAGDQWLLAVFSVPENNRDQRHALRATLTRLGFGSVAAGVWIAPISTRSQVEHQLARRHLDQYVTFFEADHFSSASGASLVAQWWDLDSMAALYTEFTSVFAPVLERWKASADDPADPATMRDAFIDYIPMFTQWRRVPYLDPGLPLEFLPADWSGQAAEELFGELRTLLGPLAEGYVDRIIQR